MDYRIKSLLRIKNSNTFLIGNNAKIIYGNDFVWSDNSCAIYIVGSNTRHISNIGIYGITLYEDTIVSERENVMVRIEYAENLDFYNTNIIATNVKENNRKVTNIDLKEYWKNINNNRLRIDKFDRWKCWRQYLDKSRKRRNWKY